MPPELEKLFEKLRRIQRLHEKASTPGEKQAAMNAMVRVVRKIVEIQPEGGVSTFHFPDLGNQT